MHLKRHVDTSTRPHVDIASTFSPGSGLKQGHQVSKEVPDEIDHGFSSNSKFCCRVFCWNKDVSIQTRSHRFGTVVSYFFIMFSHQDMHDIPGKAQDVLWCSSNPQTCLVYRVSIYLSIYQPTHLPTYLPTQFSIYLIYSNLI